MLAYTNLQPGVYSGKLLLTEFPAGRMTDRLWLWAYCIQWGLPAKRQRIYDLSVATNMHREFILKRMLFWSAEKINTEITWVILQPGKFCIANVTF